MYVYTALRRLRASSQVEEDIEEMRAEERAQQAESSISIMELICSPTLRAPLIIGIVMQLSQQLSGINAVSVLLSLFRGCTFILGLQLKKKFIILIFLFKQKLQFHRWIHSHYKLQAGFYIFVR